MRTWIDVINSSNYVSIAKEIHNELFPKILKLDRITSVPRAVDSSTIASSGSGTVATLAEYVPTEIDYENDICLELAFQVFMTFETESATITPAEKEFFVMMRCENRIHSPQRTETAKFQNCKIDHFDKNAPTYGHYFVCCLPAIQNKASTEMEYKIQLLCDMNNKVAEISVTFQELLSALGVGRKVCYKDNFVFEIYVFSGLFTNKTLLPRVRKCYLKENKENIQERKKMLESIERSFAIPRSQEVTVGNFVQCCEMLLETPYNTYVPYRLAKFWKQLEEEALTQLLAKHYCILKKPSFPETGQDNPKVIVIQKFIAMKHYSRILDTLEKYEANFRSSKDKKKDTDQHIPVNCHIHKFFVRTSDSVKVDEHNFITAGAFAAHSFGFSKGGMKEPVSTDGGHTRQRSRLGNDGKSSVRFPSPVPQQNQNMVKNYFDIYEEPACLVQQRLLIYFSELGDVIKTLSSAFNHLDHMDELKKFATLLFDLKQYSSKYEATWQLLDEGIRSENHVLISNSLESYRTLESYRKQLLAEAGNDANLEEATLSSTLTSQFREDAIVSQALTALITSFVTCFSAYMAECPAYALQLAEVGFLIYFESLLSTYSDESGMLDDMKWAVNTLKNFKIKLSCEIAEPIGLLGNRKDIIIAIRIPSEVYKDLPDTLKKEGSCINICPILVTQGVNEGQSIANRVAKNETNKQREINKQAHQSLKEYTDKFERFFFASQENPGVMKDIRYKDFFNELDFIHNIPVKLVNMSQEIERETKLKNITIFDSTDELTTLMRGGKVISCKSAKDRTSMSVTRKETKILMEKRMEQSMEANVRDLLRSRGVRVLNAKKNTGSMKYAFNSLQIQTLPHELRPPKNMASRNVKS